MDGRDGAGLMEAGMRHDAEGRKECTPLWMNDGGRNGAEKRFLQATIIY